jgi:hypothetical protein
MHIHPIVRRGWLSAVVRGAVCAGATALEAQTPERLQVITVTPGFRHSSIPTAEQVIAKLAEQSGSFTVDSVRTAARRSLPTAEVICLDCQPALGMSLLNAAA